jgi:predicted oxidoreductase
MKTDEITITLKDGRQISVENVHSLEWAHPTISGGKRLIFLEGAKKYVEERLNQIFTRPPEAQLAYQRQITCPQGFLTGSNNLVPQIAKLQKRVKDLELHNGLSTDARIKRLERARDVLIERVDALEGPHQEISPDSENYYCIGFDSTYGRLYARKPEREK